jgi:hypothetical protein
MGEVDMVGAGGWGGVGGVFKYTHYDAVVPRESRMMMGKVSGNAHTHTPRCLASDTGEASATRGRLLFQFARARPHAQTTSSLP